MSFDEASAAGYGRLIQAPTDFTDDDGSADPRLREALAGDDADAAFDLLLAGARLLVPIVAVAAGDGGGEKSSHMASVSLVQADGRRGLLAFTSLETLRAWDPGARPVPARAPDVARAALDEGADGVLVDVAGPVRFAIDGPTLRALAGPP